MRSLSIYISALLLIVFGSACEKVIEVDLNDANPQYVFEGNLLEGSHDFEVSLTLTGSYFDPSTIKTLDEAAVILQEEGGESVMLEPLGEGIYQAAAFEADASKSYQLEVEVDGQRFEANSYLSQPVALEELIYEFQETTPFQDAGYLVSVVYNDPVERENYYRVMVYLNGELLNGGEDLILLDDNLTNGNRVEFPIFARRFALGDSLEVELRSLDKASYVYFESLADIAGGNGPASAAPGNPVSNWSGSALGYFSAYSSDRKQIVIE